MKTSHFSAPREFFDTKEKDSIRQLLLRGQSRVLHTWTVGHSLYVPFLSRDGGTFIGRVFFFWGVFKTLEVVVEVVIVVVSTI